MVYCYTTKHKETQVIPVKCLVQYEQPVKGWSVTSYDEAGRVVAHHVIKFKNAAMLKAREGQMVFGYDILMFDRRGDLLQTIKAP